MNDFERLRDYASHGTEDSFRAVVETHAGLVRGAALRLVGNPQGAEEVAQAVFIALAQKAGSLPQNTVLAGWLHTATRFAAAHWLRAEQRRRQREQSAVPECVHAMNETDQVWEEIAPHLDTALASLGELDRHAVLLRFFEDHSFKEVGARLGMSEDAVKMRVTRAVDKLRRAFKQRGIALSALALLGCLSAHAATPASPLSAPWAASVLARVKTAGNLAWLVEATLETLRVATLQALALKVGLYLALTLTLVFFGVVAYHPWRGAPATAWPRPTDNTNNPAPAPAAWPADIRRPNPDNPAPPNAWPANTNGVADPK